MLFGKYASRKSEAAFPNLLDGLSLAWVPSIQSASGITVYDLSGRNNAGTSTNLPAATAWVRSEGRQALDFSTALNRLSVTSNTAFAHGTRDFAYAMWFYPRNVSSNNRVFSFADDQLNVDLGIFGTGSISYYNGSVSTASAAGVVTANRWQHLTMMRASGVVRVFINATEVITHANVVSVSGSRTFHLGGFPSQNFNGMFDSILVYLRSLKVAEIRRLGAKRGIAFDLATKQKAIIGATGNRRRRLLVGAGS